MKIGFIYGGQGSQVKGMGYDLYLEYPFIKDFYNSIKLDFPLKDLSFHGDLKTISRTEYTQPIMLAFQLAVTKVLDFYNIRPDFLLGLSLGEYSCLYTANVVGEEDLFRIIQYRARAMGKASEEINSKMLAVFSDNREEIESLCQEFSTNKALVQVSNINTRGQIVIGGEAGAVLQVKESLEGKGYRTKELNTSGPFHTSYMDKVSLGLEEFFKGIKFMSPEIPIIYNLYGDFYEGEDIKETMAKQVNHPVLFKDSLEKLVELKPDLIIEVGHKNTIKGLLKRISKDIRIVSVNTVESIKELVREVKGNGE